MKGEANLSMRCIEFLRFYIILQGSVNIYRLDDDSPKAVELGFDTVTKFRELDDDPDKREQFINQAFGNYIVTLSKISVD